MSCYICTVFAFLLNNELINKGIATLKIDRTTRRLLLTNKNHLLKKEQQQCYM